MNIKIIGVVGSGQMGVGIAQVIACARFKVVLMDVDLNICKKALIKIEKNLYRLADKNKILKEDVKKIVNNIQPVNNLSDFEKVDFVIEAATESVKLKLDIFRKLDSICPTNVILASNTSSISITKIAGVTNRPELIIGMHFMNPVPIMKLVEVIKGLATSEKTYRITDELCYKLEKIPVESDDFPGFLANRILMPMINEAIYCLMEGVGTVSNIDNVMKLGMNHPMGPLALADLIGLDTCLAILEVLHRGIGDDKYRPSPLLKKYVDQGWLGQKTKRGFYEYK